MPFGPSQDEVFLLLQLPFILSISLMISLLFGWRRFKALIVAAFASAIYITCALAVLQSFLGAIMLMFSGWAVVLFLTIALFASTRRLNKSI
jgi:hypothetical protein